MIKIDDDIIKSLTASLEKGFDDETINKFKKQIDKAFGEIQETFEYQIKDDIIVNLSYYVKDLATKAVRSLLAGDEAAMRYYLNCERRGEEYYGFVGRTTDGDYKASPHRVSNGEIFEGEAIALRRKIAHLFTGTILSERLLDLEDQVKSLIEQIKQLETRNDELRKRIY